jgi:hypothetical protein
MALVEGHGFNRVAMAAIEGFSPCGLILGTFFLMQAACLIVHLIRIKECVSYYLTPPVSESGRDWCHFETKISRCRIFAVVDDELPPVSLSFPCTCP